MAGDGSACFTEAVVRGCRWLRQGAKGQPTMLLDSRADVELARRVAADAGLSFGIRFETLDSLAASCWDLLGDGRRIVDDFERQLLVRRCLSRQDGGLRSSAGLCALVASIAAEGLLPPLAAQAPMAAGDRLSPNELMALRAASDYRDELAERSLVDMSEVLAAVAADERCSLRVAVVGAFRTTAARQAALDALQLRCAFETFPYGFAEPSPSPQRARELQLVLRRIYGTAGIPPVEPAGAVRFLLPAGAYATSRLVSEQIADYLRGLETVADDRPLVVVAAKDPGAAFDDLAPWLQTSGLALRCVLEETRALEDTSAGRALLALLAIAGECSIPACASDFALSPLSGIGAREAARLDARWRRDRLVDRERVVGDMVAANPALEGLFERLLESDFQGALDALRTAGCLGAPDGSAEDRGVKAALEHAATFFSKCALFGVDPLCCLDVLGAVAVPCSGVFDTVPEDGRECATVLVTSLPRAASRPPCSCGMLVLLDMSAAAYPVKAPEDPVGLLCDKMQRPYRRPDALGEHRRIVFRALESAADRVVLARPRFDEGAFESYPSISWEDLADTYRACGYPLEGECLSAAEDGDLGIPRGLSPYAATAGERAINAGAYGLPDDSRLGNLEVPQRTPFELRDREACAACPAGARGGVPVLSPSAIEAYLECPAKWFAQRRLRLDDLDGRLGPQEEGTFAHSVLRETFERLARSGIAKPDARTLGEAKAVLGRVFDEQLKAQRTMDAKLRPLIALDALEAEEVQALRRRLLAYLERDSELLRGFAPQRLELSFGTDEPFAYGGWAIRGSVDRVDVNGRGQAVVIDYKGSAGPVYELASASSVLSAAEATGASADPERSLYLPHRVQALIYAQAVRRLLGVEVVGALYVPYNRAAGRAFGIGAYDPCVLGPTDIPGVDVDRNAVAGDLARDFGVGSFGELLDAVERRVGQALGRLTAGDVAPAPRGADPCAWCSFGPCPERR